MNWLRQIGSWIRSTFANPEKWLRDHFVGPQSAAGPRVTAESAQRSSAVFACVQVRSQDLAKMPCILYRRRKDGGRDRAVNHPLYNLISVAPNDNQTAFEWREMGQAHVDLRGNAYSLIVRDGRQVPVELIALHPDWVVPLRAPDGTMFYDVRLYGGLKAERYPANDILHIRDRSDDGFVGKSCITRARDVIGLDLAGSDHASKFFANGAQPGGIIAHPSEMNKAARKLMADEFQDSFSGDNKFKVAVISGEAEYMPVGMSNLDAQFIDGRKLTRQEIAALFRVPAHKIGIMDNATFSNIEQQALEYVVDTLMPIARRWEMMFNKRLLKESEKAEYYFEFLFDSLLRGDSLSRWQSYAIGRQWGVFSVNDICELENRNHVAGGEERITPLNMWPLGQPRPEQAINAQPPGKAYEDYGPKDPVILQWRKPAPMEQPHA